jgi:hypothetical protein
MVGADDPGRVGVDDVGDVRLPAGQRPCSATNRCTSGMIVLVSARFPSNASTINGIPVASVNKPTVICGSSRRSLEKPGSRNPSPVSVSNQSVVTSYKISADGPISAAAAEPVKSFV